MMIDNRQLRARTEDREELQNQQTISAALAAAFQGNIQSWVLPQSGADNVVLSATS
jgi:hypothetical protein